MVRLARYADLLVFVYQRKYFTRQIFTATTRVFI
jgi:hypothetical protein